MSELVQRLRFDATRCEMQFSKGVAGNIEEAADVIERLTADLEASFRSSGIMAERIRDQDTENERLRADLSEFEELKRIAADSRYSSEIIGIRLRNLINQQESDK